MRRWALVRETDGLVESVITTRDDVRVVEVTGKKVRPGRRYRRKRFKQQPPATEPQSFLPDDATLASVEVDHAVFSGGQWIPRPLDSASLEITVEAGEGRIRKRRVAWARTTVTTPASNALIVVRSDGTVRAVGINGPEKLPDDNDLLLLRTYASASRIYQVLDARTWATPQEPVNWNLRRLVESARIPSGEWRGAVAESPGGSINWYFANLGLYAFVEELPQVVEEHLNVQVAKFYGRNGTGRENWGELHGTAWNEYRHWPHDVVNPLGAWTRARADSHDAYAATFCWLAARFARSRTARGMIWWNANVEAIQNALLHNIIRRRRPMPGGAGELVSTFQGPGIYDFCQALDNIEVYRGTADALSLMSTSQDASQRDFATAWRHVVPNLGRGIQNMWLRNRGTLSQAWSFTTQQLEDNPLNRFYPDYTIGLPSALFEVPLHELMRDDEARRARLFDLVDQQCPDWWRSRRYDLYPWGMAAAAAVKQGRMEVGEQWLRFVRTHLAKDTPGYFKIHEVGWARYIELLLDGKDPLLSASLVM